VIWALLMGANRAKYHLMTGERITGEDAARYGLMNFVVEDVAVLDKGLEIADRLASGPGLAITASKVGVNQYIKMVVNLVLPVSLAEEFLNFRRDDAAEAIKAFQEKQQREFHGRWMGTSIISADFRTSVNRATRHPSSDGRRRTEPTKGAMWQEQH
jgi:enoyl-CoA hydratase